MAYDLALITPTADQPTGIALCERWMAAQTVWGKLSIQWIVIDDGIEPATLTLGQTHVRREREPECTGWQSLSRNVLTAIPLVDAPYVAMIEHDDYYAPGHLEGLLARLTRGSEVAGPSRLHYYHLARRVWRIFDNANMPALCQLGMRASMLPALQKTALECEAGRVKGLERGVWQRARRRAPMDVVSVVGMKGLPGLRGGIGYGHRPDRLWRADPELVQLGKWVGPETVEVYRAVEYPPLPIDEPKTETVLPLGYAFRSTDRGVLSKPNYLRGTMERLLAQSTTPARMHVHVSKPSDGRWVQRELAGLDASRFDVVVPAEEISPNLTGISALEQALAAPEAYAWIVLMEDDITFCADFHGSVARWLTRYARPDRNVYRFYGFFQPKVDRRRAPEAFDHNLEQLRASQIVALRRADAVDFASWSRYNLHRMSSGRSKVAFDKLIASWALARWPRRPGVLSWPFFVDHIGTQSSIHPRGFTDHRFFAGTVWTYS